jgi:coenzyme F420-reducing hydrogenase alpha subunit
VAYQTSACNAMEEALGIELDPPLQALRRLFYCGEWIESHCLHVFLLHLPDFLGFPDGMAMAAEHRPMVERGLRMKKAGNAIIALLGGRSIHPINARVGGFYRVPTRAALEPLLPELEWGQEAARQTIAWAASLPYPAFERDYEFVSLAHPSEYAIAEGRLVSSKGLDIPVRDWGHHFVESQVPHSTALVSSLVERGSYFCGPLARFNNNFDRLSQDAKDSAIAAGLRPPVRNLFKSLLVRLVEVQYAFGQAAAIIRGYREPERPAVEAAPRVGVGHGCSEAPRGSLYHRYSLDERGLILDARIVPPTSQNQRSVEEDLRALGPMLAELPPARARALAEQAVRSYDPCISCSVHALEVRIERG